MLQRYFKSFRRRLRDKSWKAAFDAWAQVSAKLTLEADSVRLCLSTRVASAATTPADAPATAAAAAATATATTAEPYANMEEVDEAIKPLSEGCSLWVDEYPDTNEGREKLQSVLRRPEHATKLARLAATVCDRTESFSQHVVMCAKGIALDQAGAANRKRRRYADAPTEPTTAHWWGSIEERAKWGKYLPFQRLNVNQVPMPFVFEMDHTYELKGAKRVAINQLGPLLSKRQCTAQVCFRLEPPPPPPAFASPETRKRHHVSV